MDDKIYYVFSIKMAAWWGAHGVYTSDVSKAKQFTHEAAIDFCRSRFDSVQGSPTSIPVSDEDMQAVLKK